jgi:hypothetical protein
MDSAVVDRHLSELRAASRARRNVPLESNGFGVSCALEAAFLPPEDARCGVFVHRFQYGGSVPEGWAEARTLVLADAVVETVDYDVETNTFVEVLALTEARADELERAVRAASGREGG